MATTYEPISTVTFNNTASSYSFTSIPQTYTDLRLVVNGQSALTNEVLKIGFNNDYGANYSMVLMYGNGSVAVADYAGSRTYIYPGAGGMYVAQPTLWLMEVFQYTNARYKTTVNISAEDNNGNGFAARLTNTWRNTAAVSTIMVYTGGGNNFASGTATLYGIKAA